MNSAPTCEWQSILASPAFSCLPRVLSGSTARLLPAASQLKARKAALAAMKFPPVACEPRLRYTPVSYARYRQHGT